jgi:hypothetical protein
MTAPAQNSTLYFFSFVLHFGPDSATFGFNFFFAPLYTPQARRFADVKRCVRCEHLQFRKGSDATGIQRRKPRWENLLKMETFISTL